MNDVSGADQGSVWPVAAVLFMVPLFGRVMQADGLFPWSLLPAALMAAGAAVTDARFERIVEHLRRQSRLDDAEPDLPPHFRLHRNARAGLLSGFLIYTLFYGTPAFPLALLFYLVSRTFCDSRILARSRPPLGLISMFTAALALYLMGAFWPGIPVSPGLLPGLGLASMAAGDYLQRRIAAREQEERIGLKTLVHRIGVNLTHAVSGAFTVAGIGVIAWPLRLTQPWMSGVIGFAGVLILVLTVGIRSPRLTILLSRLVVFSVLLLAVIG